MKIQNHAPYQLSNYEVLTHVLSLQEDMSEQAKYQRWAQERHKGHMLRKYVTAKEADPFNEFERETAEEVPEGSEEQLKKEDEAMRRETGEEAKWVIDKVVKYMGNWYMPTTHQHPIGVHKMVLALQQLDLSKREILQVVNTMPLQPVSVYTLTWNEKNQTPKADFKKCIPNLEERYPKTEDLDNFYQQVIDIVAANNYPESDPDLAQYRTKQSYIAPKGHVELPLNGGMSIGGDVEMDGQGEEEAGWNAPEYVNGTGHGHGHGYDDEEDDGVEVQGAAYVDEAAWGPSREGAVDDDAVDND